MYSYFYNQTPRFKKNIFKLLVCSSILVVIAVGFFLRFDGIASHVTYIDELMILTEGDWNSRGKEDSYSSSSALEFAKKVAEKRGVTYAPLQFVFTYALVKNLKPLSMEGVAAARIPSAVFGCLSILIFLVIMLRVNEFKASFAYVFPLALLAVSQLAIINSQQAHTYSIGLFAFFLLIAVLTYFVYLQNLWLVLLLTFFLALIPTSNYLVIPILLSSIFISVICIFVRSNRDNQWKTTSYKLVFMSLPIMISVLVALWVLVNKSGASIPWWVRRNYALKENTDYSIFELVSVIIRNLSHIGEVVFINSEVIILNSIPAVASAIFIVLGVALFLIKRKKLNCTLLPLLLVVSSFVVLIALFLNKSIALAPSRHALVFIPILLIVIFYSLLYAERIFSDSKLLLSTFNTVIVVLSFGLVISGVTNHLNTAYKKEEAISAERVMIFSKQLNIKTVLTDWNSYNKLYLQFEKYIKSGDIILKATGDEKKFPEPPFLLVGSAVEQKGVYWSHRYRRHRSKILYEERYDYDMEPSTRIRYWPNQMVIYLVEKK